MTELWATIEPHVMMIVSSVLTALGGGGIVYVICRQLIKAFSERTKETYNTKVLAKEVAALIAGKSLKIDLTAITEKSMREFSKEIKDFGKRISKYDHILALIAGALVHLKALSSEERQELISAIEEINKDYEPPVLDEPILLKLEMPETQTQELHSQTLDLD